MLTRLMCGWFGHQDTWPSTEAGRTTVRCSRCNRISSGISFTDDVKPPIWRYSEPSRVVSLDQPKTDRVIRFKDRLRRERW